MKNKLLCLLFLCILMSSCNMNMRSDSNLNETAVVQQQPQDNQSGITILKSNTSVRIGEPGFITIQGRPRVRYTIRSTYRIGDDTIPVVQWRASEDGVVTFNWVVDPKTVPGTYSAEISGGGTRITVYHTVLP